MSEVDTSLQLGDGSDSAILPALDLFRAPVSCPPEVAQCGIQPGRSDGKGYWGDSQFYIRFIDATNSKPLVNREGTLKIFDWSGTRVLWETRFTTRGDGWYTSPKLYGARGLPFRVCSSGYFLGISGGSLVVYDFLSANICQSGTTNPSGKDTSGTLAVANPNPVQVNLAEVIKTGSYCPAKGQILTQESLPLGILGGTLGVCRNLDTQVYGRVLDNAGKPVVTAEVKLTYDPTGASPLTEIVYTGTDGRFVSSKVSRIRGRPVQACAKKADFAKSCLTTTAPAKGKDAYFEDGKPGTASLRLHPNKDPIGSFSIVGTANAAGNYPTSAVLQGWAYDPDHTSPLTILLQTKDGTKSVVANLASTGPCTTLNVCNRPNTGFRVDLKGLNFPVGKTPVLVAMRNVPKAPQASTDVQYQPFPAKNPVTVEVAPPPPPPRPETPANFRVTFLKPTRLSVYWDAVKPSTGVRYQLGITTAKGTLTCAHATINAGQELSYAFTGLNKNTAYRLVLCAVNSTTKLMSPPAILAVTTPKK